ncbi:Dystonin [Microtus ochrogaster]|uniref:Dystonin n=1 Tax=Microtus ochrogaster TaxID=79684 RepID=A0A8J6G3A4_MICOH|nr:Dystonin [Microtus ochrogaster]
MRRREHSGGRGPEQQSSGNASYRCSMSSSADFSDEDDFSQKSGSASPAPGDTLPWNLPKHERSKRKIHGGSVLDPAERAVLRIAELKNVVSSAQVRKHVNDLYEDLRDGHNLISLLEVLSGDTLPREKGRMRFHRLQNVQIALDYLKRRQVKLVNIRNDDITDGNPNLTLGLIWTIILHFQISDIHVTGESEDMSAKERLLLWTQQATEGYAGVRCENFTTCWRDGKLFNAIIHKYRLDMLQQIAARFQRDSVICEDKLILARNALQSDSKRLESGVQFQNEAEIAGYILECENLLRQHVIDVQILIDGKYYQADQLVQRVAKLRDEIMALRNECSSVYSKGRMLTTEQTKLMISGISQSLNSGFAQTLHPSLNSGLTQSLTPSLTSSSVTSGLSSGMTSRLTPSITPAYTPGFPSVMAPNFSLGVEPSSSQTLKLMQIRKPLLKSALLDQNLTEEEVNMKFVQDLLNWVDEMQVQLDRTEWGSDLPSVESHLENHKNVHRAIEEFEASLKEAKISEIQMTAPLNLTYTDKLHRLESQYAKLLNTSRNQERHLDTLHNFVTRATNELIWLNEKEEEEVAYDWSERNTNVDRKKGYHAELMRELEQKEENIKAVQEIAEQLLLENHPARLTIEAYRAAMQTQWSWVLQLCQCVEQHIKENTAYFEFFNEAKEATDYLRNLKDAIQRKYSCDRSSAIHKLEDLVQESMEEKEELLQYRSSVAGLMGRAKTIVQLKPRNPDNLLKTSIPITAICDYRQIEITIYKDDECVLANNSHRAKWKVISPTGNEAMVPSVCFTVPPPNKEAVDFANRIEQQYQSVLALWHESHINMKSVVSWHYLVNEIDRIRASNVASIKTMLPGEHQQVLSNLQSRLEDFLEDSQDSQIFSGSDVTQLEKEVNVCRKYYQELLKSAEREEQEESVYNLYISEVRNIRLRLESCEDRLIRQIRTPLERDDLHESMFRITEQEKLKKELERLKDDLATITNKCEEFFSQAADSPSVPTLRSELSVVVQSMNQIYSMSSTYIEKLKTVNLVLKNTQEAEALVKLYETKLCEEEAVIADKNNIENLMSTLKQWRSEVDEKRGVFHALEDELQKAKAISDEMFKAHKERDLDFDWHKEKADQMVERWQNVHVQIDNRLRDLEGIGKSLKYYRDSYHPLDDWIQQIETTQRKIQENQPENSKALALQLNQQKMLVSEIEVKQSKMDECQKYSEQYSAAVKDYELQTMTYRAMVDSQQKSPVKRRRMQSSADLIIQEFMDLRTRYTALVTLMTQYIKFAGDSLKRLEEEEIAKNKQCGMHTEVTSLTQEKKLGSNAGGWMLEGSRASGGLKGEFLKKSMGLETSQSFDLNQACSVREDEFQFQGLRHSVTGRQLVEAKLLDLKTVEQLRRGLKTVEDVQKSLSRFLTKATSIAGLYLESTKEKMSFASAAQKIIIDKMMALAFLEAQAATGFIIDPISGQTYCVEDAVLRGIVDPEFRNRLLEAEKAVLGYTHSSKTLSVFQAMENRMLDRKKGKHILEAQIASGGVIDPVRGIRVPPETAVQQGLLNNAILQFLHEPSSNTRVFPNPNNKQALYYAELLQMCVFDVDCQCFLLPFGERDISSLNVEKTHKISVVDTKTGAELTAHEAFQRNLIDKSIYLELSGQQYQWKEATFFDSYGHPSHMLTDIKTGLQFNISEAVEQGTLDKALVQKYQEGLTTLTELADFLLSKIVPKKDLHSPIAGYWLTASGQRISLLKASRRNLIDRITALRCLEAQVSTGGIIDPLTGKKYRVAEALHRGLVDEGFAQQLRQCELVITGISHPVTNKTMSVVEAVNANIISKEMGMRCLEFQYLTGGLIEPQAHSRLSVEEALQVGIIDVLIATRLKDQKSYVRNIICPQTKRKLTYKEALEKADFDFHTGLKLMEVSEPLMTGISSLYYSSQ